MSLPRKLLAEALAYIGAAYWFTASTSFANPAAVFGRMFSDSFAGIAARRAMGFIAAELIGGVMAVGIHGLPSAPLAPPSAVTRETQHV